MAFAPGPLSLPARLAAAARKELPEPVRVGLRRFRRGSRQAIRRVPLTVRIPIRDSLQRVALRIGKGEVVPAAEFESFLTGHLRRMSGDLVLAGDYMEFGVYLGTSLGAAVRAFDSCGLGGWRFFGFDSFAGLPDDAERDGWVPGLYAASRSVAEWHLRRLGVLDRVTLVEGWFDETLTPATIEKQQLERVLVAMVDCDTYGSAATALRFVEPLLAPRCLVILDDWYTMNPSGDLVEGERRAFEELLADCPQWMSVDLGRVGFCGRAFELCRNERP